MGPEPIWDLGGLEGHSPFHFEQISHIALLPGGNLAVADMAARQIHFISPSGEPIARRGRQGRGPGEFDFLWGLATVGDQVFAYDPHLQRLTIFDSEGALSGVVTLREAEGYPPMFEYYLVGGIGGDLLFSPRVFTPSPGGRGSSYRDSAPNLLFTPEGECAGEVAEPSGIDMFVSPQGASSIPFSVPSLIATSGDRVYLSHGMTFEVRVFGQASTPSAIFRRALLPRPLTPLDLESAIAAHLSRAGAESPRDPRFEGFRRMMESAPLPKQMPALGHVLVDTEGFVWCEHYRPEYEDGPSTWSVFSPAGDWLGEVRMPTGFEPGVIGAGYAFGVHTDSLEVPHLRKLPLARGRGGELMLLRRERPSSGASPGAEAL